MAEERLRLNGGDAELTAAFDAAMAAFGPFERTPHLAVAVSGGADSMVTAHLADAWARRQGGRVTALIVDHGLRAGSADEAQHVCATLRQREIDTEVLTWTGAKPERGVQEAARSARYALLEAWCRDHAVLHLLTGHHGDDQAETIWMRLQRGSGPDGLAGMSAIREFRSARLLRPLLGVRKGQILAFAAEHGLPFIDDPSNGDPRFARSTARRTMADAPDAADGLLESGRRFAGLRQHLEAETAAWIAQNVRLFPSGYAEVTRRGLSAALPEIRTRVLSHLARCIGGADYGPGPAAVERLADALQDGGGSSLGRAVFAGHGKVLRIFREHRNLPAASHGQNAGTLLWDGRFLINFPSGADGLWVRAYADVSADEIAHEQAGDWLGRVPSQVRGGLPVFEAANGAFIPEPGGDAYDGVTVRFAPRQPLGGTGFFVA